jgi:hypothetical protein
MLRAKRDGGAGGLSDGGAGALGDAQADASISAKRKTARRSGRATAANRVERLVYYLGKASCSMPTMSKGVSSRVAKTT